MHEIGLAEDLAAAARRRAAGRPVARVRVHVGTQHRVDQPSMDQAFALVTQGTELEGADLDLVLIQAKNSCRSCGQETLADEALPACPACGGVDVELAGGDELLLESIQLAAPVPASQMAAS